MTVTSTDSTETSTTEPGDRPPPLRILHGAGNVRALLPLAHHPAVDAVEADLWVRSGRLLAHHARPLAMLPLVLDRSGLHREPRDPVDVAELLEAVGGEAELVLDLRSWFGDPAPDLAAALLPLSDRSHLRVTCESWSIADRLLAWVPDLRVAYSIRSERQLRRYIGGRIAGTLPSTAVAVRHTLLHSAAEVAAIRRWSGHVGVWTVDEAARARELASWGVDALTSNELSVLSAVFSTAPVS